MPQNMLPKMGCICRNIQSSLSLSLFGSIFTAGKFAVGRRSKTEDMSPVLENSETSGVVHFDTYAAKNMNI